MLNSAQGRAILTLPRDAVPSAESMLSIYLVNGATAPLVPSRLRHNPYTGRFRLARNQALVREQLPDLVHRRVRPRDDELGWP
jgi:hypothetical protein